MLLLLVLFTAFWQKPLSLQQNEPSTVVSIHEDKFYINDELTYHNRLWNGYNIQGLLFNARLVQGIFDDLNPETSSHWVYPDTKKWNPERNTNEFIKNMPDWNRHGLLGFTVNLQGGSPEGYSRHQPWFNSAFTEEGELRPEYMKRLEKILDRANELGMVPILGFFYFGQDQKLKDENAVIHAVDNTVNWLFDHDYFHVLIEINNECNINYDHEILRPERVHELIERVKNTVRNGKRYLVSTSYGGNTVPGQNVVESADFILLHGNGISDPNRIIELVYETRNLKGYKPMPILFNEDDHYDFDKSLNNFVAAISSYVSWGYFDYRRKGEDYHEGFQSVPVDWSISSERKKSFFNKLKEITGY
jgi:hypothetical protein